MPIAWIAWCQAVASILSGASLVVTKLDPPPPTNAAMDGDGRGCTGMLCSVWQLPEDGKPTLHFIIHANHPAGGRRGLPTNRRAVFSLQSM